MNPTKPSYRTIAYSPQKKVAIIEMSSLKRLRLRFTYGGKRYQPYIPGGISSLSLARAKREAESIETDIINKNFDPSLGRYFPEKFSPKKQGNLLDCWQEYKEANPNQAAITTQEKMWRVIDCFLSRFPIKALDFSNAHQFVSEAKKKYSESTIKRVGASLSAALNWWLEIGKIEKMPPYRFKKLKYKPSNKSKKAFTIIELKAILDAFLKNIYCSKFSKCKHSHYYGFVAFIALTGCRPMDARALEWSDIIEVDGNRYISFSKGYVNGIIKGTKTNKIRQFPINQELNILLEYQKNYLKSIYRLDKLIFPSINGGYINSNNFTRDVWSKVVRGLVEDKLVREYLPLYNERHSFCTLMLQKGIDLGTLASLVETSVEMLSRHYLSNKNKISLPEIF